MSLLPRIRVCEAAIASYFASLTKGTISASRAVTADASKDVTGGRHHTITGTMTAALLAGNQRQVGATVAATGTNQGNAAAVAEGFTLVTAADGTKGVKLPTAVAGARCKLKNNTNAVLKVWPFSGDAINAIAADSSMSIAAFTCPEFEAYDATTWYTNPLLPS